MNIFNKTIRRVPEVTFIFWVIKTLSTTVGETGADFFAFDLAFGMSTVAMIASGVITTLLYLQFFLLKRYVTFNYWSIVVLMSILGTLITDILVDDIGISLMSLSIYFILAMLIGFFIWYLLEGTLSIHSIDTTKREAYYWLIILLAFALGTGVGDLLSEKLALGYGVAVLVFSSLIALVMMGYYAFNINETLAFWLAYILTRPLGASLGDWMIQPVKVGGLGINIIIVNTLFFIMITLLVTYLNMKQNKELSHAN
jgi:uncharacterized membrane-anchored protein